ncbi:hypothetical protein ACSTID_14685 [Vibrio parahaemolyticus]
MEVQLEQLPDIDLYLYQGGQLVLKSNADQIIADREKLATAFNRERIVTLRQAAYKAESDPLYMEWQYDSTSEKEQAWRDKVAEIKARYPLLNEAA